jgi:hypothetical protein
MDDSSELRLVQLNLNTKKRLPSRQSARPTTSSRRVVCDRRRVRGSVDRTRSNESVENEPNSNATPKDHVCSNVIVDMDRRWRNSLAANQATRNKETVVMFFYSIATGSGDQTRRARQSTCDRNAESTLERFECRTLRPSMKTNEDETTRERERAE